MAKNSLYKPVALVTGFLLLITILSKKKLDMDKEKAMYKQLKAAGFPEIMCLMIVAQSKFETSIKGVPFMSRQALVNNNYFGYGKVKGSKYQIADQDGGKHPEDSGIYAKYASLERSVADIIRHYKARLSTFSALTTCDAFANALKTQGYFTTGAKEYAAGMRKFYKTSIEV